MDDKTSVAPAPRSDMSYVLPKTAPTAGTAMTDEEHSISSSPTSTKKGTQFRTNRETREGLIIKKSKNGRGVFAVRNFRKGETVIRFCGERLTREELLSSVEDGDGHYIQIGKDLYLGASGGIDDFFNHSCEPNAGVVIEKEKALLVAIKPIPRHAEITFDYSTTMDDDWEEMKCNCKSSRCRKYVRDFKYLTRQVQKKYLRLGIVPGYIRNNYR